MIDPNNEFVIKGVAHAYNLRPDNYADVVSSVGCGRGCAKQG